MNQNTWMGVGRVANKPQLKPYKKADGTEGYRCFFRLAITRLMDRGKGRDDQRASFIPIVCWGEPAKRHAQYLDVGTEVCIVGELIVDANRKEDGTYGADFFNVTAHDIQYGAPSLKNAGLDVLQKKKASLETQMENIRQHAGGIATTRSQETPVAGAMEEAPVSDPTESPASTPAVESGNPFEDADKAPAAAV